MKTAEKTYNNYVVSNLSFCLNEIGLFKTLYDNKFITENEIDEKYDFNKISSILENSVILDIISSEENGYRLTSYGKDLYENIGFFTWAVGGYSAMFKNMSKLLVAEKHDFSGLIEGEFVSKGSNECNVTFMQEIIDGVIDNISFSKMADLGCGNGKGLMRQLKRNNKISGIGIDINSDSIEIAKQNAKQENLDHKLIFHCRDVFNVLNDDEIIFEDVEVVTSFMMFHDLMNIEELKNNIITKLRKVFPNVKYFVIGDTFKSDRLKKGDDLPIFTTGFELIHSMAGTKLFPNSEYEKLFADSNLNIQAKHFLNVPNTYLYVLSTF